MAKHKASASAPRGLFKGYEPIRGAWDELFGPDTAPHPGVATVAAQLAAQSGAEYARRQRLADIAFARAGITFTVYSDARGVEKTFPFDLIPHVITAAVLAAGAAARRWRAQAGRRGLGAAARLV
jgi:uncharacterized circularly permuted ATP-grasp superfamily protein